jgi:hypothetical protein
MAHVDISGSLNEFGSQAKRQQRVARWRPERSVLLDGNASGETKPSHTG